MAPHLKESDARITFSKVKYGFQNMLAEIRVLKSKENSAKMEAESLMQKLRSTEAEQERVRASLNAQVAESVEARHKLENNVKIMALEMSAMENNVKCSKTQLKAVLESRNTALEELKISKYELEQKLKNVMSQLAVTTEKLGRNTMLFEAVEHEASSVKRVLEETRQLVTSRSDTVTQLQDQVQWMVDAEQKLVDKARTLEAELKEMSVCLGEKDKEIVVLKELLEESKNDYSNEVKLTLVQKASEAKDRTISQLNAEKQNLISETDGLRVLVRRLQEGASEQDSSLQVMREKLLKIHQLLKEKTVEAEERLRLLEEKDKILAELVSCKRLETEDMQLHHQVETCDKSTSTDDLECLDDTQDAKQTEGTKCNEDDEKQFVLYKEKEDRFAECVITASKLQQNKTCICGYAPSGDAIKCVECENNYHQACISWQGSGYLCTSCKDQPAKKKIRTDILK